MTTVEWARERLSNSRIIANAKTGEDREGWLEDVAYWEAIVETFEALRWLVDALDSGSRRGRCLDHLPVWVVDRARACLSRSGSTNESKGER